MSECRLYPFFLLNDWFIDHPSAECDRRSIFKFPLAVRGASLDHVSDVAPEDNAVVGDDLVDEFDARVEIEVAWQVLHHRVAHPVGLPVGHQKLLFIFLRYLHAKVTLEPGSSGVKELTSHG